MNLWADKFCCVVFAKSAQSQTCIWTKLKCILIFILLLFFLFGFFLIIERRCPGVRNHTGTHFLHWNQNYKVWVTWPRIAQSVYFLREMCLFFNLWMIKFTIMVFFDIHAWNISTKVLYMSKNTLFSKMT